jgi:hypothetical protein
MKAIDYSQNAKKIAEANDICQRIGTNMKFKQCFIKQMVDSTGRKQTLIGKSPNMQQEG